MERLKHLWIFPLLLAGLLLPAQPASFSVAAQAALDRAFASQEISFLLLDAEGRLLAQRWPEGIETPVPPGSLVKPWLALAFGEQHRGEFPSVECRGTQSRCWYPRGHGRLTLQQAIAESCNAYFLELAAELDRARARRTLARYGLRGPAASASDAGLVGLGGEWTEAPLALARAYLTLATERGQPTPSLILNGMSASASHGTARAVDDALGNDMAFTKTGTALCTHRPRAAGDGFTVVLYPAAQPRFLLLVRVHGTTGASSAKVAASMLQVLGAGTKR